MLSIASLTMGLLICYMILMYSHNRYLEYSTNHLFGEMSFFNYLLEIDLGIFIIALLSIFLWIYIMPIYLVYFITKKIMD